MRISFILFFLATAALVWSQTVPADAVVATVNGRKITAGEIRAMVAAMPKNVQAAYERDPKQFMREYAWYSRLVAMAEQNGLEKKSPYKEALEFQRMLTLVNAQLNEGNQAVQVRPEQQQAHYEQNKERYKEARAKLIYIPFSATPGDAGGKKVLTESEAKAKAEKLVQQARSGADFVKLVKEHSEDPGSAANDGDLGMAVRPTTQQVPEPMRNAILALKPGEISEPIRHENGYYIFLLDSAGVLPYEKVKDEIYKELKEIGFKQWQDKTKSEASVQFENEAFFQNVAKP
jgi:parvulin-like peptidyl-prolyl isomerase